MARKITATLYLTRRHVWVVSPQDTSRALLDQEWDGADLSPVFQQLSHTLAITHLTILLGNDMSFVFVLPNAETAGDADLWERIQEHLPIDVSQKTHVSLQAGHHSRGSSGTNIQVLATIPAFLQMIRTAAKKNGILLEAITSIAVVLTAYTASATAPQIILWESLERLTIVGFAGAAYGVTFLPPSIDSEYISQQRSRAQSAFGIVPSVLVVDDRTAAGRITDIPKDMTIQHLLLDPLKFDSSKTADPWKDVLTLSAKSEIKRGTKHHSPIILVGGSLIIILLLIIFLALSYFRY